MIVIYFSTATVTSQVTIYLAQQIKLTNVAQTHSPKSKLLILKFPKLSIMGCFTIFIFPLLFPSGIYFENVRIID